MALIQGRFIDNIGRVYAIYTGGFLAFILLMAVLEQLGVGADTIGILFVAFTIAIYAIIGWLSRTMEVDAYYVAGRQVPAVYNGMATAADWMSGASFVALAGGVYFGGYGYMAFIVGWTGGYVLVNSLMAPYLRKFGCYTVPDFIGTRYGGNLARLCAVIVLVVASFTYVTAQINATGTIAARALHIPFSYGVWFGLLGILLCSMLGGMRAVTWTQVAQYIVLIVAYLLPAVWMSTVQFGIPVPQLTYGGALSQIAEYERLLDVAKPYVVPFQTYSAMDYFFLIFCLMVGTASLPHILMRFFTTPTVREARKSVGWSLLFIFLLYFTAPAYAAFSKFNLMGLFVGAGAEANYQLAFTAIPQWMIQWGSIAGHQLVTICGVKAETVAAIQAACEAKGFATGFPYSELKLNNDMIVLSTPSIAGMPIWVVGLVGAGGFAAALSTADGLLLAIANALSHDVYYKMIDPKADAKRRLLVAKILLVVVALAAAFLARTKPSDILSMVAWAFSIAAAGLFAPLVMGVWWKRTTTMGGVLGMAAGFLTTMYYLIGNVYGFDFVKGTGDEISWFGVASISAGVFGVPVAFLVTYVVSLITPEPSEEMQDFVDRLRLPKGGTMMVQGH